MALLDELLAIHGMGINRANLLIRAGLTRISDLDRPEFARLLTDEIRVFMQNRGAMEKFPRRVVDQMRDVLTYRGAKITGSYARGKKMLSDIDIVTLDLPRYLRYITSKFDCKIYACGPARASLILRGRGGTHKLDIFAATKRNLHSMILYTTGSGLFNIAMRRRAKSMGYMLNQDGLFSRASGRRIPTSTDRDVFRILKMPYVPPHER